MLEQGTDGDGSPGGSGTWFDLSRQTVQPRWQQPATRRPRDCRPACISSRGCCAPAAGTAGGGVTSACMRVSGEPRACAARPRSLNEACWHTIARHCYGSHVPIRRMAVSTN